MNAGFEMLKITPVDTLFLGGGKSFSKGESSWHQSRLIPYPSVFYGAICSAMLEKHPERRRAYLQNKDRESDPRRFLELGAVYLYRKALNALGSDIYVPAPLDIFVDNDGDIFYGSFTERPSQLDCPVKDVTHFLQNPDAEQIDRVDGMFIKLNSFLSSYFKLLQSIKVFKFANIAEYNYKIGIAINERLQAEEGHLYRLDLMEFKNWGWSYLVEYRIKEGWGKEENQLTRGYLKMGGEYKSCRYEKFDAGCWSDSYQNKMNSSSSGEYVKLYIATPTFFKNNSWKPDLQSKGIEVVAGVTGKPYSIGGFDMVLKRPKPMRKAVPEGSIFLLKSEEFIGKSYREIKALIFDVDDDVVVDSRIGFGQMEVLPCDKEQIGGVAVEY